MSLNQEGRILLAMQALKQGQSKSIQVAAISYDVPRSTLRHRINRMLSRRDSIPNSQKLTPIEELAIIRYILDLDSRGFPPRINDVRDIADLLCKTRHAKPVGKQWLYNFVQRCPKLKMRFSRAYDF